MKKIIFRSLKICTSIILVLWIASYASHAGVRSQIQLLDGTLIQAEIISFSKGIYKLRSKSLGVLSIPEEKVQSIHSNQSEDIEPLKNLGNEVSPTNLKIQGLKSKLTSDPKTMEMLLDLGNDPSMVGVLNDKDLMRAIQQGDLSTVIKNPKINKLMKSKAVRDVIQRSK